LVPVASSTSSTCGIVFSVVFVVVAVVGCFVGGLYNPRPGGDAELAMTPFFS